MKFLLTAALAILATNAFAEVSVCSGSKDGKNVVFTIVEDADKNVQSISVAIDGARVGQNISKVRSTEIAGGTMVTAQNDWGISSLSVFGDADRGCFAGTALDGEDCYLGFVALYEENIHIGGIDLSCE